MKYTHFLFLFFVLSIFSFWGCTVESNNEESIQGTKPKIVLPTSQFETKPLIEIPDNYRLSVLKQGNFDGDLIEEQILTLVSTLNQESPLLIQVIDYDTTKKSYYVLWSYQSQARGNWPHEVLVEDLVGDGYPEIIVRGQTIEGLHTLEIIKSKWSANQPRSDWSLVFNQTSVGNLDYNPPKDSNTKAYSIQIQEPKGNSTTTMDYSVQYWQWSFQAEKFQFEKTEFYSIPITGNTQFQRLLQEDTDSVLEHLSGPWYQQGSSMGRIIQFDPTNRSVILITDQAQELYEWDSTSRGQRNVITIRASNELVHHIKMVLYVVLTDTETITLTTQDSTEWTGSYERLSEALQKAMALKTDQGLRLLPHHLSGLYRSDTGTEINFEFPIFSMIENQIRISGAASIYTINNINILQLKSIRDNGKTQETRSFRLDLQESRSNQRILRRMILVPGQMTVSGFRDGLSEAMVLEQTEMIAE